MPENMPPTPGALPAIALGIMPGICAKATHGAVPAHGAPAPQFWPGDHADCPNSADRSGIPVMPCIPDIPGNPAAGVPWGWKADIVSRKARIQGSKPGYCVPLAVFMGILLLRSHCP